MLKILSKTVPYLLLPLLLVGTLNSCQLQQESDENSPLVPLVEEALGEYSMPVSTSSKKAQAYFDQGMQLGFAFGRGDAKRSFMEAEKLDSTCAICHWGEAWALGPYLNNQTHFQDRAAYQAAAKAYELAESGHANDLEKALIKAMRKRYDKDDSPGSRAELDTLYANAMGKVYQQYPSNPNVASLYAEALFLLEPRSTYRDIDDPDVSRIVNVLEKSMEANGRHPGLCHFYIHILEATDKPEKAIPCADYIGRSIPGASHINHMPSHIYNRVGQWGKSVEANLNAWHTDQKAKKNGTAFAIYPGHNLHMLMYVASMDGQGAIAIQAGKDFAKSTSNNMYQTLALIRFGRFEEVLDLTERPEGDIPGGIWDFTQGYAHLKTGSENRARRYLENIQNLASESDATYRGQKAVNLLGSLGFILEGEMLREQGELEKAEELFQRAVEKYDMLTYSEPETLPFSPRHWLGSVFLGRQEYENAEKVYRKQLEHHPNNGWSLYGLKLSLAGQKLPFNEVKKEFKESWQRSDTRIEGARF